jgi:multiple sugar transport system substrate-binding protein
MRQLRDVVSCAAGVALAIGIGTGEAAASDVRVVVSYYSAESGPIFEAMAEEFEKNNPDIDVQIEVVNWDNLEQKLTTDVAGGTAPDISIIGTRWLAGYVKEGIAEPLDRYMTPEFKAKFIDVFMSPSVFDGETYGLPVAASARAMYYNKAMFEQAEIAEPPATRDELKEAATKISALGDDVYGFGLRARRSRPTPIGTTRFGPTAASCSRTARARSRARPASMPPTCTSR